MGYHSKALRLRLLGADHVELKVRVNWHWPLQASLAHSWPGFQWLLMANFLPMLQARKSLDIGYRQQVT